MASAKNSNSNVHPTSQATTSISIAVDPLPIRKVDTTTPIRPLPLTASSSSSASSTSSNLSSRRIFDSDTFRPQTPLTPPDESPCKDGRSLRVSNDVTQETPSLKVRRRPGRPRLTATTDQYAAKVNTSPQAAPKQNQSQSEFQQLSEGLALPVRRAAEAPITATEDNITFVHVDPAVSSLSTNQPSSRGPAALPASNGNSSTDEPIGQRENEPGQNSEQKVQRGEDTKQKTSTLEFIRYGPHKNARSINESIKMTMAKPKVPTGSPGWTYVLESPDRAPGHLKIGNTMTLNARDTAWKRCEPGFTLVDDTEDMNGFDFHSIVESLVHQELHNSRKKSYCERCKKPHDEWFEVKKDDAFKSIHQWRNWIKVHKPYQICHSAMSDDVDEPKAGRFKSRKKKPIAVVKQWKLTPYWQWKVNNLPKIITEVDWDVWTQPSQLDYLDYWIEEHWGGTGGYYFALKRHFNRKDKHFFLVGMSMILIMHNVFGGACSMCTLIGLIAL